MIITMDGPSGSGKSTLAKKLSKILKIPHVDSGSIYRGIAYYLIENNISEENVVDVLDDIDIKYTKDGVRVDNKKLKFQLRTPEVANMSSIIATKPEVREKVNSIIRESAKLNSNSIIVDGRDIGSSVLPDAEFKFFIEASPETRARRRYNQMKRKNLLNDKTYYDVLNEIKARDKRDMEREHDPLVVPDNAIIIDTSKKRIKDNIDEIVNILNSDMRWLWNFYLQF